MELIRVTKRQNRGKHPILFVRVTDEEALQLIGSLSAQILAQSPNVGRLETFCTDGTDFSIGVLPREVVADVVTRDLFDVKKRSARKTRSRR